MTDKKAPAEKKTARPATRRRKSLAGDQRSRQLSRPLLIALLVVIVGGGYLFWPRGGGVPTGIGEQYSVVTADSTSQAAPRSGSVDINGEQSDIVAEPPEERPTDGGDAERTPEVIVDDAPAEEPAAQPAAKPAPTPQRRTTTPPPPPPPKLEPLASGPWAVQLGAYKTRPNAEKVVSRLAEAGIEAHVRAANTSSGEMIHRVWIGWFKTRTDAQTYARQRKDRIGEAYPVHR